jgi:hypothetical protein
MRSLFIGIILTLAGGILYSQQRPNYFSSAGVIGKGNIQSEAYYNQLYFLNGGGTSTSLIGRYGLNKSVDLQFRLSHFNFEGEFNGGGGILPIMIGSKQYVYSSPKTKVFSNINVLLPITSGDIDTEKLGYHLNVLLHNQYNDIFGIEAVFGIINQIENATPYLSAAVDVSVTDFLSLRNKLELLFPSEAENSWYRTGLRFWISEDIDLSIDYGVSLKKEFDNRFSLGLVTRWLD